MKKILRDYPFAWVTILIAIVSSILWCWISFLYINNLINFELSLVLLTLLSYISFTPMHEACHGNIVGRYNHYKKIESFIGHLSAIPMFIPYGVFKSLHLKHHAHTNDPHNDPDYWVATRNPFILILKVFTIKLSYYGHVLFKSKGKSGSEVIHITLSLGAYILFIIYLSQNNLGLKFFILWISSSIISLALLAFLFDWLPHTPHKKIGRYIDTRAIDKKWLSLPMLWQNYHVVHHLYPRVPFYRYRKVFFEIEDELVRNDCIVTR